MKRESPEDPTPLCTRRNILGYVSWFVGLFLLAWGVSQGVLLLCKLSEIPVDIPSKWPLSCITVLVPGVQSPVLDAACALGVLAAFAIFVHRFANRVSSSLLLLMGAGFLLIISTNLIHGKRHGLASPHLGLMTDGRDVEPQYYHDAVWVTSAEQFLRDFENDQANLSCHSRTHPPGAVLLIYALRETLPRPSIASRARIAGGISLAMTAAAVGLSACFLFGLLAYDFDRKTAGYVTLLFLMIPAVQIYYCATLDAVIAGLCLAVLYFLRHARPVVSIVGMSISLLCVSFLTFGACFLVPVLVGYDIVIRRRVWRSLAVLAGVAALYAAVDVLWGFNYFHTFRAASALENPDGFLLFSAPVSYVMTRMENVADIVFYLGPFLLVLFVRGIGPMWRDPQRHEPLVLTLLGIGTLAAMFVSGAFRTGETARACLFIYPFLMLPVASYLQQFGPSDDDRRTLLWLVFGQALIMQTVAGYFW